VLVLFSFYYGGVEGIARRRRTSCLGGRNVSRRAPPCVPASAGVVVVPGGGAMTVVPLDSGSAGCLNHAGRGGGGISWGRRGGRPGNFAKPTVPSPDVGVAREDSFF